MPCFWVPAGPDPLVPEVETTIVYTDAETGQLQKIVMTIDGQKSLMLEFGTWAKVRRGCPPPTPGGSLPGCGAAPHCVRS